MKRLLVGASLLLCLLTTNAGAQSTARVYVTFDTESITVAGTAIGFTASKIAPAGTTARAGLATFVVECSSSTPCPVRITTVTATPPTSSVGLLLNQGDIVTVYGYDDISAFKAIRTTANSAVIQPQYSR